MSFTVQLIIIVAVYVSALALLGLGFKKLYAVVGKNEAITDKIDIVKDVIEKVVVTTNQTFVNSLKAAGTFGEESQKQAFELTKNTVTKLINDEYKTLITNLFGDFDEFIKSNIEYYVSINKTYPMVEAIGVVEEAE